MNFRQAIGEKNWLAELNDYGERVCYNLGIRDIDSKKEFCSQAIEYCLDKNFEISDKTAFKKGMFGNIVKYIVLQHFRKNRIVYKEELPETPETEIYKEKNQLNLRLLKGQHLKIVQKLLKYEKPFQIRKDLGISQEQYSYTLKQAKLMLKGEKIKLQEYKGVVQYNQNSELIRVYHSLRATKEQGFDPKRVGEVCNGKSKLHKEYKWTWLKK